jgi:type II secretory pathway component PulF
MPDFEWEGVQGNGVPASGRMTADSKEQVISLLRAQGIQARSLRTTETGTSDRAGAPGARTARTILILAFAVGFLLILAFPFLRAIF